MRRVEIGDVTGQGLHDGEERFCADVAVIAKQLFAVRIRKHYGWKGFDVVFAGDGGFAVEIDSGGRNLCVAC